MNLHTDLLHLGVLVPLLVHDRNVLHGGDRLIGFVCSGFFIGFLCAHDIHVDIFSYGIVYSMDEEAGGLTYDDILETLNVRLHQGRLEAIHANPGFRGGPSKQPSVTTILPDNPHLQNSYIYNKYFKNYVQEPEIQEPKVMTREEYRRYVWEKRREAAIQRERIRFKGHR
jgi:hypothetical protein